MDSSNEVSKDEGVLYQDILYIPNQKSGVNVGGTDDKIVYFEEVPPFTHILSTYLQYNLFGNNIYLCSGFV